MGGPAAFLLPEELPAIYWLRHWQTARNSWKTLAALTVCGAIAGLLIAAAETPLYHATTSIEVQGITDNVLKAQDGNPNAGADTELMDLQTQIRIMESGSLVARVLQRLGTSPGSQQAARSLHVYVSGQTRIIEIASDSADPKMAAAFVNTLADAFIDQHVEARWQGTQRGAEKLQHALDDMRIRLEKSEAALQAGARESGLLLGVDRGSASEEKLHQLQAELSEAQAARTLKQARFDALSRGAEADLPAIVNDPAIQDAQAKLTDLRRQLADLGATYTSDYSKVKRIQAQTGPLEAAIAHEVAGTKARALSDYAESRRHEELLNAAYLSQVQAVGVEAGKKVHYDALRREVDSTRGLYDIMLARVKEAAIASTMRASNVRVLDRAVPPSVPFQPRPLRLVLLGALAGLFLGAGAAVAREQADGTVRAPGALASLLGVPELACVPPAQNKAMHREAFRSIAASLLFSEPPGAARALVITSAAAGEGKTSIAAHLAVALAETGKRVLLIDGDLRNPRLHREFGIGIQAGLADLLAYTAPLADSEISAALRDTAHPHIQVLCAGHSPTQSPDLLYSPRLAESMDYGRKNFDIVLVDSPPMGQMPDARVLARAADAVLLVVRSGKTAGAAAAAVRQRLFEDKTPMLGCILNRWNSRDSPTYSGPSHASSAPAERALPTVLLPAKS